MNRLKPYFAVAYTLLDASILIAALVMLVVYGVSLTWLGALLAAAPFLVLFIRAKFSKTPRTSRYLPLPTLITLVGFGLAIYASVQGEATPFRLVGLISAAMASVGFVVYVNWYSLFNRPINPKLATGKQLPDFEVQTLDGETVESKVLHGKPALLLFYRGGWCPICMAQVDEVASGYRALIDRGVRVALISPQPPDLTRRVAEMYDVAFDFWVDDGSRAAAALGIINKDGVPRGVRKRFGADTVLPTAIIVDGQGHIIFTDQTNNYRVRPNPELFVEALSVHGY